MTNIQRLSISVAGSVLASVAASWALRRLLLAAQPAGDARHGAPSEVVVVIPIIAGNTWGFRPRPNAAQMAPSVRPV